MTPGHALHRRHSGKGQEIGAHVHADVGKEQDVQFHEPDRHPGFEKIIGQIENIICGVFLKQIGWLNLVVFYRL